MTNCLKTIIVLIDMIISLLLVVEIVMLLVLVDVDSFAGMVTRCAVASCPHLWNCCRRSFRSRLHCLVRIVGIPTIVFHQIFNDSLVMMMAFSVNATF